MLAVTASSGLRLPALLVPTTSLGSLLVVATTSLGGLSTLLVTTTTTTLRLRGGYCHLGHILSTHYNLLSLTLAEPIPVLASATTTASSGTTKGKTFTKRIRTAHFY
jgi:hypothetical protein